MSDPQSPAEFQAENEKKSQVQSYSELNIDQLPPEAKQKLQKALERLKSRPTLFNMVSGLTNLAKTANQVGAIPLTDQNKDQFQALFKGLMEQSTNSTNHSPTSPSQSPQTITTMETNNYVRLNQQRNLQPTFNPNVKGDSLRRNIFIIAIALLVGYLVIKFGFNGQLPF